MGITSGFDKTISLDHGAYFVGKLFERAKNLPASVPPSIRKELADLSAELNGGQETLRTAKKEDAENLLGKMKEKARDGIQKYVREGKTAELKNNKNYEKLLAHAKSFDDIRAGDIHRMRSAGENISNFLLTDTDGDEINLSSSNAESLKNKPLLVNFGDNRSVNASIGLGDILPYEAKKVEITTKNGEKIIGTLGSEDSRKGRRNRVGYYDDNGKYIAVYSGYSIKILETSTVTAEERHKYDTIQENHLKNLRIKEILQRKDLMGENYKDEFPDASDQLLFERVEQEAKNQEARKERNREFYGKSLGKERFLQLFGGYLNEVCEKHNVPPTLVVRLFEKENDTFDFTRKNPKSSALGFGQITDDTWASIEEKLTGDLDRFNPKDQILASIALLADIKKRQGTPWPRTALLYHSGEGLMKKGKAEIDSDLAKNEAIAKYFQGSSSMTQEEYAEAYAQAAEKYYQFSDITDTGYVRLDVPKTGLALKGFISNPVEYTENGVTACSRTAWKNLQEFGITGPRGGSAKESEGQQTNNKLGLSDLLSSTEYNVVDMYVDSGTINGKIWGHRCIAVKGTDKIWYVLDPYNQAKQPTPMDTYLSNYQGGKIDPNPRFYGYKSTNYLAKEILS